MLQVKLISDFQELEKIASQWDCLTAGVPFRRSQWLHSWWKHYGLNPSDHVTGLFTIVVYDESQQLLGVAPLYREQDRSSGQTLKLLAAGEVCTDYSSLLVLSESRRAVIEAIANYLITQEINQWDMIQLDSIAKDDRNVEMLVAALQSQNCTVHYQAALNTWRLSLPECWEDFLASLSKSHRKQLRRLQKRVLETDRAKLHCAETAEQFQQGWQILVDLHQRRRQSLNEPGCFASPRFAAFHQEAASELLKQGMLRLYWLCVDDRPVAAEYQIAGNDCIYAYQAGVEPTQLDLEPGRLITIATLQKAMDEGYRSFDFLRGDEPYKAHFRAEPRQNVDLRIVAPKKIAKARHQVWLAGKKIKEFAKRQLPSKWWAADVSLCSPKK